MKPYFNLLIAILVFSVLYSPQPLLPTFAQAYRITEATSGMLMTATLIPLAAAPLLYGYLLAKLSTTVLLKWALLGMAFTSVLFALSGTFWLSFLVRFAQGLLIPAAIIAITTNIAASSSDDTLQHNMSLFITGSILGGMFGRILAGAFASYISWQAFYGVLALGLFAFAFMLPKESTLLKGSYPKPQQILATIKNPRISKLYVSIFCLFFCFVAVLNYLPFIIQSLLKQTNHAVTGFMYSGFIMGALTSLNAKKLAEKFGTQAAMTLGYVIFILAILGLLAQHMWFIFCLLFAFCGGHFLVHSLATAQVNRLSHSHKSIVNAVYVSCYYTGGAFGSYFPGLVYQYYGHEAFVGLLLVIATFGLLLLNVKAAHH